MKQHRARLPPVWIPDHLLLDGKLSMVAFEHRLVAGDRCVSWLPPRSPSITSMALRTTARTSWSLESHAAHAWSSPYCRSSSHRTRRGAIFEIWRAAFCSFECRTSCIFYTGWIRTQPGGMAENRHARRPEQTVEPDWHRDAHDLPSTTTPSTSLSSTRRVLPDEEAQELYATPKPGRRLHRRGGPRVARGRLARRLRRPWSCGGRPGAITRCGSWSQLRPGHRPRIAGVFQKRKESMPHYGTEAGERTEVVVRPRRAPQTWAAATTATLDCTGTARSRVGRYPTAMSAGATRPGAASTDALRRSRSGCCPRCLPSPPVSFLVRQPIRVRRRRSSSG